MADILQTTFSNPLLDSKLSYFDSNGPIDDTSELIQLIVWCPTGTIT